MKKIVLVTGSAKNLGAAIIEEYAKNGFDVVINYNKSENEALELKRKVEEKYNVNALVIKCNITKEQEVKQMVKTIIENYGQIDVLVNNAALELNSPIEMKNLESFRKVFDVNVIGTFLVTKYTVYEMMKKQSGKIINISSNNGIDKFDPYTLEYDASKAAIISMTKNFAKEYAPFININAIAPGWIKTSEINRINDELDGTFVKSESEKILLNRFAECNEIAKLVYFLGSNDSNYINGEVIVIDGGSKC